ncbi:MAG: hypothetical protein IKE76_11935 [Clostridia bacterium]|nr:hypothetical protein [Clostridia bacterium]
MAPGQGCGPLPLPPLVYVGKVASDSELPSSPRIGWTFVAEAPGVYAGHSLNEGDAVVCIGMAPAEWTSFAGPVDHSMFVKFTDLATASKTGVVYVDPALDSSSANPVENRAISVEMDAKADAADFLTISNREIFDIVTGG